MDAREFPDTIEFLAQTPQRIAAMVAGLADVALRRRPAPGIFSPLEQVCHLRDIEQDGYKRRVRRILDEDNPLFEDLAGDRLAIERDYQSQDLSDALDAFARARRETLR